MDRLDLIKNDIYLKKIIDDNNLSDSFVNNNSSKFIRTLKSRDKCNVCKGLYECNQLGIGQRLALKYDELLFEEIEYCDYKLKELNKKKHLDSYVYNDISENLSDLTLANLKYEENQKTLYNFLSLIKLNKADKGLYISGDLGVGKTYLCIALANSLVKDGKKVAFVKVSKFLNEAKASVYNNSSEFDDLIKKLQKVEYLFLDDIGSEAVSKFTRDDVLFRILDYRMENKLMTIFTSNLSKKELYERYIYDRNDKSNMMNAKRLIERIDMLSNDYVLKGENLRKAL